MDNSAADITWACAPTTARLIAAGSTSANSPTNRLRMSRRREASSHPIRTPTTLGLNAATPCPYPNEQARFTRPAGVTANRGEESIDIGG